ncbi:MAG: hypothetical protein IPJ65_21565 [Archangiaceae bacterium]|nr:hypothetical protein [Archangiaceae bacterium]
MKRFTLVLLVVAGTTGCGRLFNAGNESGREDNLNNPQACGAVMCPAGTECCNESCGTCVPPGGACDQLFCSGPVDAGPQCGPVCAIYCPWGNVKDMNGCDTCACNPAPPVQCGATTCPSGTECCNASCGVCVPPGGACTKEFCQSVDAGPMCPPVCDIFCPNGNVKDGNGCDTCACLPSTGPTKCGPNTCAAGQECCNDSCGICVPPGGACTQQACLLVDAGTAPDQQCGATTCPSGTECCNPSCGTCVPPGGVCTQEYCAPTNVTPLQQCGTVTCAAGTECCNASCGTCVPPGFACDQVACN